MAFVSGNIIDSRYEVIRKIGKGTWATIYKVKNLRNNKIYALKLFDRINAENLLEHFSPKDMHHITSIYHPNLINVLKFGNMGNNIYCLSEFYDGQPLSKFKLKPSNIKILYELTVKVFYALQALHAQGIIHKNLKSDNIMFKYADSKLDVKILDFGFINMDYIKSKRKISDILPYIAPEFFMGKPLTGESDYYSLGVILYKLTTNIYPFSIDQIQKMGSGKKHKFLAKDPHQLNKKVPVVLEKFILKLLEQNPYKRKPDIESLKPSFTVKPSVRSLTPGIGEEMKKKGPFSQRKTLETSIKFSEYFVRDYYAKKFLDYIPMVEGNNGKLVCLIGGDGLGKSDMLTLFRYHLLSDKYLVFDYRCGPGRRDPFFGLIKEFYNYVSQSEKLEKDLSQISEKFRKYLFDDKELSDCEEDKKDIDLDMKSAEEFIKDLSDIKPLIFIIQGGEYLTEETVCFLNNWSKEIKNLPILIIISVSDPGRIEKLRNNIKIKIEPFDFNEAKDYMEKILHVRIPDNFARKIFNRSAGNPAFIRDILLDLTAEKIIWNDGNFNFDFDSDNYKLPGDLLDSIYRRLSRFSVESYEKLQKLAVCQTELSNELIQYILSFSKKELFDLINDCRNNEILFEEEESYRFAYREAKDRLLSECSEETKKEISCKILEYFNGKSIEKADVVKGIIENCKLAENKIKERSYRLKLVEIYGNKFEQEKAFEEICKVIEIDFELIKDINQVSLMRDLTIFQEKTELAGSIEPARKIISGFNKLSGGFLKYYILGSFYLNAEDFNSANENFEKAKKYIITGKQKVMLYIKISWNYLRTGKINEMGKILAEIEHENKTPELEILFADRKTIWLNAVKKSSEALSYAEDFINNEEFINSLSFVMEETSFSQRMGSLYNNLAFVHGELKNYEDARKYYKQTRILWEKINFKKSLGVIYNNLGDMALREGNTDSSLEYFQRACDLNRELGQKPGQALALLNFAEAYIKQGKFFKAEEFLSESQNILSSIGSKEFMDGIYSNFALAKSKIKNWGNLYSYLEKEYPELMKREIKKFDPAIKAYFYLLVNTGNTDEIKDILYANPDIDFIKLHEEDFGYQMRGLECCLEGDHREALNFFYRALKSAEQIQSRYAQCILMIQIIRCYLNLGELDEIKNMLAKAVSIAEYGNFSYWSIVLSLLETEYRLQLPEIPVRQILREIISLEDKIKENKLFILEVKYYEIITQIYYFAGNKKSAEKYFNKYVESVHNACEGIPQKFKKKYIKMKINNITSASELNSVFIADRKIFDRESWQEEMYDLLKLIDAERIKFFLKRTVHKYLAPESFTVVQEDDFDKRHNSFLCSNDTDFKIRDDDFYANAKKSLENNVVINRKSGKINKLFIPLRIKKNYFGCLVLADSLELDYSETELMIIENMRLHLSALFIRINKFSSLQKSVSLMDQLMKVSRNLFSTVDIDVLENQLVSYALEFTRLKRGFFIRTGRYDNDIKVSVDYKGNNITGYTDLDKDIIGEVQEYGKTYHSENDVEERRSSDFNGSDSSETVYCAPLKVYDDIYGILYLDNLLAEVKESKNFMGMLSDKSPVIRKVEINQTFMDMLLEQTSIAIKNALQYDSLSKGNKQLRSFDKIKTDFAKIVAHELNTPLVNLQGNISRAYKKRFSDENERNKIFNEITSGVKRLISSTRDIMNMNKYKLIDSLHLAPMDIRDIMESIVDEGMIISAKRKMKIKLESENDIPELNINWEAFYLMIYNLVLNAIRFSRDYGIITVGVRKSAFPAEKVNDSDSVVIYVQDNGTGIEKCYLDNVWDEYFEVTDIYSHKSGIVEYKSNGLGIGLSVSKRIAELHYGKMWIRSEKGEGTSVFAAIPVRENKDSSEQYD